MDPDKFADPEDPKIVAQAKRTKFERAEYTFGDREVILYNLGIGATEKELQWTYEGDDNFMPLPTFGVVPQFLASAVLSMDWLPKYNPVSLGISTLMGVGRDL